MVKGWRKYVAYFLVVFAPISSTNLVWLMSSVAAQLVVANSAYAQFSTATQAQTQANSLPVVDGGPLPAGYVPAAPSVIPSPGEQCVLSKRKCLEPGETRNINGYPTYRACWKYEDKLTCTLGGNLEDSKCQNLRDKGCYEVSSVCGQFSQADPSVCVQYGKTFKCGVANPNTTVPTLCASTGFCMDGSCFSNDYLANNDIGKVIAAKEMLRQAGTYLDPNDLHLFKGEEDQCREGWGGIRKCCETKVDNTTNNQNVAKQIGISAAFTGMKWSWNYVVDNLTPYVYDSLYQAGMPQLMQQGFSALGLTESYVSTGTDLAMGSAGTSFTPSLSFAGVTVSYGPMAASTTEIGTLLGPGTEVASAGNFHLYFNPTMFVLFVLIMIYQYLSSCEEEEMILSIKRGQGLCYANGSYCSTKTWFGCSETAFKFCCFNSKIARIVNQQGRPQLGKPIPGDCNGFTINEISKLDFSKIDLSEFYNDINPSAVTNSANVWSDRAQDRIQQGAIYNTPNLNKKPK